MNEFVYILIGFGSGIVGTITSFYLGGRLVKEVYMEITQTHYDIDTDKDKKDTVTETDAYNWEEYDQYINQDDNQA
tara:strand:+ start:75 stop:302 length:228 start_codon:yes stop_codon:yes gene_type:complete